jgi:preprotein translocase subunit SecG
MKILFMVLLLVTAIFLIMIILVQKGKGGGLAGAFGGMGGQSAFGAKAGDLFTRITIVVAAFWIVLCVCGVAFLKAGGRMTSSGGAGDGKTTQQAPANPGNANKSADRPSAPAKPNGA